MDAWHILTAAIAIAVLLEAVVLVGVLRHLGSVLLRMGPETYGAVEGGPAIGEDAREVLESPPGVVLFVSPGCPLCEPIVARLGAFRKSYPKLTVVPVVVGADARDRAFSTKVEGAKPDLDGVYRRWNVPGTPFAVAVGADGRVVARGVVNTVTQMEALADRIVSGGNGGSDDPHRHGPASATSAGVRAAGEKGN
jgi:hypothetical protein